MKWYGVVEDASKYSPSIDPMQPSVQNGNSIRAIGVPYRLCSSSCSHMARPQPLLLADTTHRGNDVVVLGVRGLALVSLEVPPRPRVDEAVVRHFRQEPPLVTRAALLTQLNAVTGPADVVRHRVQRQREDHETHDRSTDGDSPWIARTGRAGSRGDQHGDRATDVADADRGQGIQREVVEGQQSRVPEPALRRQREPDRRNQRHAQPEHAGPPPLEHQIDDRREGADRGQGEQPFDRWSVDELWVQPSRSNNRFRLSSFFSHPMSFMYWWRR